jgi:peptidoglycan/LPS O-acetylase OafA/YrhL
MSDQTRGYLPTLDGWRAIAILSVIFCHDALHAHALGGLISTRWLYEYGDLGVDVFFAISGLLICSRLLDEERIYGKIHLKDFYVRRGFRILPPAFLYLGVISILAVFSVIPITRAELPGELAECLLICRNIDPFTIAHAAGGWYTGHFWSLSLEEQFYLLLPAFLVLIAGRFRAHALGVLAVAVAVHRALVLAACPGGWWLKFHPDIRIDALLVPAMIAVLASSPQNRLAFQRYLRFWPLGIVLFLCLVPFGHGTVWGLTVFIWLLPAIVLGSVLNPANIFGRLLEWSVLRYIGRISYGLYLWQQLFFTDHGFWHDSHPLGQFQSWPLRLVLTFVLAALSYHLLERPLMRLGYKLAPPATAGRKEPDVADSERGQPSVIDSVSARQEPKVTA